MSALHVTGSRFFIAQADMAAAEKILDGFPEPTYIIHSAPYLSPIQYLARRYGWILTFDFEQQNIDGIQPYFRVMSEERLQWLKAIAVYVKAGSYIEFHDEDEGGFYRIVFDGKIAKTIYPKWEEQDEQA